MLAIEKTASQIKPALIGRCLMGDGSFFACQQIMLSGFLPNFKDLVIQLITAAIGGSIVAAFSFISQWYKRVEIERRFPISGTYLSFFEDIDKGKRVVVSSMATVRQRGKTVSISNELANGRSWSLEGTILPGGHISGVYSADATYDQGVGSFYLRIQNNDLDGLWSGYDHNNRFTNSGRYWFRKIKAVNIKKATKEDVNDILALSTKVFGNGYLGDLDDFIASPYASLLIAKSGKRTTGFCLSYLNTAMLDTIVEGYTDPIPDDVDHANRNGKLGVIKSIAVDPKFSRRGVGSALFSRAEKELRDLGAESAMVPAWIYRDTTYIGGILKRHGYEFWFWNKSYWKQPCETKEFACVKYDGKCNCSVAFYRHSLL